MTQIEETTHIDFPEISEVALKQIGSVKNSIEAPFLSMDKNGIKMQPQKKHNIVKYLKTRDQVSQIVVYPEWEGILAGIDGYSHLVVLYWAHKIPEKNRSIKQVHPKGRKELPKVGIFSTFSPARPNPLLMTVVELKGVKDNILEVTGLDAVDGSPVLDIKPFVREFYPQETTRIPAWMDGIVKEIRQLTE